MVCEFAIKWLRLVEQHTEMKLDYERSKEMYLRVQQKKIIIQEEKVLKSDILRTFPDEPYF